MYGSKMKKLKIMILANDTMYVYNTRNEMIERFVFDGHDVVVVSQPHLLQSELKALGCRLIDTNIPRRGANPFSDLALLRRFVDVLGNEKPDIVLTFNIKSNVYGGLACRIKKIPYISNVTGLGTAVESSGLLHKISTQLYKAGISGAKCVFFQNEDNKKFFENHGLLRKGLKTRLIPGSGVSLKLHKTMPYPADKKEINFLFVARIMKAKGADLYLNAAKKIHSKYNCAKFHVCGDFDDERYVALFQEAEKEGSIICHGVQKNMLPFYEMAHCVVLPSFSEGMSNVLLEAAAHCRPIITSDRPGCKETVNDGKTGFIVSIKNEDALVDALEKFIAMTWEQQRDMGLAGRSKIEKEFDRQIVVNAYVDEITKIEAKE